MRAWGKGLQGALPLCTQTPRRERMSDKPNNNNTRSMQKYTNTTYIPTFSCNSRHSNMNRHIHTDARLQRVEAMKRCTTIKCARATQSPLQILCLLRLNNACLQTKRVHVHSSTSTAPCRSRYPFHFLPSL